MPIRLHRFPSPFIASARRGARAATALVALAVAACEPERAVAPPAAPDFAIVDAAHSATLWHVYFLPPTVQTPPGQSFRGVFDPTVQAIARICAGTGVCRPTDALASFTLTSGTGGPPLQVSASKQSYTTTWDTSVCATGPCALVPGAPYRLHVYSANARGVDVELGWADITVVAAPGPGNVDLANFSRLVVGQPYVIAFRIEREVNGSVAVSTARAPFKVGETQQLTATVSDLRGATIKNRPITWVSSDPTVTTVDPQGVVTAVAPGNATISAIAGLVSGSTQVTVISASIDAWTAKASMPGPRYGFATGVVNGLLYAAGGANVNGGPGLAIVEAYDPVADAWTARAPMATPRYAAVGGAINGVLYVVGGLSNGNVVGSVEAYDPATNTWSPRAPMPTPRYGATAGVVNGVLYVAGGFANGVFLPTVEAYDPITNTWTARAPMSMARYGATSGVINGLWYVAGGSGTPSSGATFEAYDPATNSWTSRAPLLAPRQVATAGVVNGLLYVVGGFNAGSYLATVDAYDPATDSWAAKAPMSTLRYFPGAGVVNGTLYVAGGQNNFSVLSSTEAYLP